MKLHGLQLLTADECRRLHEASLAVLETTGVKVLNSRGRQLLQAAGARLAGDLARLPRELVSQALRQAPKAVTVFDRCGNLTMELRERNSYFGAGGPAPQYWDEQRRRFHPFRLADCARLAHICDACEHLEFDMAMAHCADAPVAVRDLYEVAVMIRNSPKPIIFTANSPDNVSVLAEIFRAAGSRHGPEKPYGIFYSEPISPLTHAPESLDKIFRALDEGFPILYTPAPMAGATGPATLAGNIVVGNAEWLSGLALAQLYKPGAAVIYGGVFANLDYGTCIMPYGSAELHLQTVAVAEMGRHYCLPSFGTAGCSDASGADMQSGFEAGVLNLLNLAASANLIHDVGWLASASATSAEQLLINNAMIAHCKRLMAGIEVNEQTLALNVIREIGPGGSFLAHDHTLSHYQAETLCTRFWDRRPLAKRLRDKKSFMDGVITATKQLLRSHRPVPMTDAQTSLVDGILKRATKRCSLKSLPDWLTPAR
ncbi:MAG: trimethylamine methyltransferase family protein [Lentisphaerae bacterium]|nr:trimethylamine methyltransferase family protein [Lentisphaerota bacterium]